MAAGEFYARNHNRPFSTVSFEEFFTELELVERQNLFLNEYFQNVSKLYELSRMSDGAVDQVRRELLDDNKVYTQAELEELRRSNPRDEYERRARTPSRANFQEIRPTHALATHELLEVMDDVPEDDGQTVIGNFVHLFASGEMDRLLSGFSPHAQAGLIDEMKVVKQLIEEFIEKKTQPLMSLQSTDL